ncbi:MAG: hypothetical protein ABSH56_10585 [Bryobacteraceae bacterium]|jgi:hypothetical protein
MQWTALDLKNLAATVDDTADAVMDLRNRNAATLTQEEKDQLTTLFGQLVSAGEEIENKALQAAETDIEGAVADLQNGIHDANHALKTIANVQKGVTIGVAVFGVASSILHPTPGGIFGSLGTLLQAIQQKPTGAAAGGSTTP